MPEVRELISLDRIRPCLEGQLPSTIATCDPGGEPNITYISQVHYVDPEHVALTFQFFNKTRRNILANPRALVTVIHPCTAAQFRLSLTYLRTEEAGALFETMKARLAAIAAHTGMEDVFRLRGADVYRVLEIEAVPGLHLEDPARRPLLGELRSLLARVDDRSPMGDAVQDVLRGLAGCLGVSHSMLMLIDAAGGKLYTIASHGYRESGIGSEIPLGYGVAGTAARYGAVIRIPHATVEYSYAEAMRRYHAEQPSTTNLETRIRWPGLPAPRSQLAIPLTRGGGVIGVLFAESTEDRYFSHEDEDAMAIVAAWLARLVDADTAGDGGQPADPTPAIEAGGRQPGGRPLSVRFYSRDGSIFLDQDYLIKGVAGAILWRLLKLDVEESRTEFSNRELRLDRSLRLPEIGDNLEARLVLLQRRLQERSTCLGIEKLGRGRFRLRRTRPVALREMPVSP